MSAWRTTAFLLTAIGASAALGACQNTQEASAARGESLAIHRCSACHEVHPRLPAEYGDVGPRFADLMQFSRPQLAAALNDVHIRNRSRGNLTMPAIDLTREDREDAVSYIVSLRERLR